MDRRCSVDFGRTVGTGQRPMPPESSPDFRREHRMGILFLFVNGIVGTAGSYLVFKRFRHLGLMLAGLCLTVGSIWSMSVNQWMPMVGLTVIGVLLATLVGDPLDM